MTLIAGLLLPVQARAAFQAPSFVAAGFDLVVLRPFWLTATVCGAALFLPVAVVTAPGGRDAIAEATERFVTEPVKSTFQRQLGDF